MQNYSRMYKYTCLKPLFYEIILKMEQSFYLLDFLGPHLHGNFEKQNIDVLLRSNKSSILQFRLEFTKVRKCNSNFWEFDCVI